MRPAPLIAILALLAAPAGADAPPLRVCAYPNKMPYSNAPIAIGFRKEDEAMKRKLDEIIAERRAEIAELLERYGVPIF